MGPECREGGTHLLKRSEKINSKYVDSRKLPSEKVFSSHPNIVALDAGHWVGILNMLNKRVNRAEGALRAPPGGAAATVTTVSRTVRQNSLSLS